MIETIDELMALLSGTALEGLEMLSLPILETNECALIVRVKQKRALAGWNAARSLLAQTGRWPILSCLWEENGENFSERVAGADLFNRFGFHEQPGGAERGVNPRAMIERSYGIDADHFLEVLTQQDQGECLGQDIIESMLRQTKLVCGHSPSLANVQAKGGPESQAELERWLMEWEIDQHVLPPTGEGSLDWFAPQEEKFLLLLPTASSWESLAYIDWWGCGAHGAENIIAVGKHWEERFGAQVVGHMGTILNCTVARPPKTAEVAWSLAREHYLIAPCIIDLSGESLRHYTRRLINHPRWCLHERP